MFVILNEQADLATAAEISDLEERRTTVYRLLVQHAEESQRDLRQSLDRFGVGYQPYTTDHVVTQLQLLLFAALAFGVLMKTHLYPHEVPSVNLDFDWTYRYVGPRLVACITSALAAVRGSFESVFESFGRGTYAWVYRTHGPKGVFARTWSTGAIAFWAVLGLFGFLALYFWGG